MKTPEVKSDGTIEGTSVEIEGVDIMKYLTGLDWEWGRGGAMGIVTVSFPAFIELRPGRQPLNGHVFNRPIGEEGAGRVALRG